MYTQKLHAGAKFPDIKATLTSGEEVSLSSKREECDWKMVVVYRGKHCPICTKYLNALEDFKGRLLEQNIRLMKGVYALNNQAEAKSIIRFNGTQS